MGDTNMIGFVFLDNIYMGFYNHLHHHYILPVLHRLKTFDVIRNWIEDIMFLEFDYFVQSQFW